MSLSDISFYENCALGKWWTTLTCITEFKVFFLCLVCSVHFACMCVGENKSKSQKYVFSNTGVHLVRSEKANLDVSERIYCQQVLQR